MPSVDKAIINPFEPLGVGEALLVAVSGLLIVFVMLAMLPNRQQPPPPLRWMRVSWLR